MIAFYGNLPAHEAFALRQRFEFHYTPKSAIWLNMIEIEFSALARQCLDRRIATLEQFQQEVFVRVKSRMPMKKIIWQFSPESAGEKMNSHYQRVFAPNIQYQQT